MRSLLVILLTLLLLTGCTAQPVETVGVPQTPTEATEAAKVPLMIVTAGQEQIEPYPHGCYVENSELSVDFASLQSELPALVAADVIPQLHYREDLAVSAREDVRVTDLQIYDEDYQKIKRTRDISKLADLEPGIYYVGIFGHCSRYVNEVDGKTDSRGWEFAFRCVIEP